MGESPQEGAAKAQRDDMSRLQERFLSGDLSASSRFDQILPYINNAQDIMKGGLNDILAGINRSVTTRAAGMGQQIGDSLLSMGIAPGHDTGNAWVTQMSPLYASGIDAEVGARSRTNSMIASLEAGKGATLSELMALSQSGLLTANQLESAAIGGMKDSTVAGDIMGGITTLAKIAASIAAIVGTGGAAAPGVAAAAAGSGGFDMNSFLNYNPFNPK